MVQLKRASFINAESTTTASCCLPHTGITAALPLLYSVILTVVTEGSSLSRLDTLLWDSWAHTSMQYKNIVKNQRCRVPKHEYVQATVCLAGGCLAVVALYLIWDMCVASLSAAVTVGGKVKAMKCLGSNRA